MTGARSSLIEAASAGDRSAIAALLCFAQPDIRRYARRSCRSASDVEDAVQETLIVLFRRVHGLKRLDSLSAWLLTVVRRQCLRLAARLGPASIAADIDQFEDQLAYVEPAELRLDLASAIQSLPPHYRAVVLLRDVEEQTVNEIALRLCLSRESVKARLHRARVLIREYLTR